MGWGSEFAAGRMVYDGYGMSLTNTLPLTLTGTLPDLPDAATGLVHQGGGRWYDPALGRPLEPNTAGGPPTLPQALNRYAATPLGQPGVYEAAQSDAFNLTPHAVGFAKNTAVELARDISVITGYTYEGIRRIAVRGSYQTLTQNLPDALQEFPGRLVGSDPEAMFYLTRIRVQADTPLQIGVRARQLAQELTEGLPDGSLVQTRGGLSGYVRTADAIPGKLDDVINLNYIGFGLDFAIGFAFQFGQDYGNPYLTSGQAVLHAGVSGVGGAATSLLIVSAFCGPGLQRVLLLLDL